MDYLTMARPSRLWKNKADFFRPFRTAANEAAESINQPYDPSQPRTEADEPDLSELNNCLTALADIFPDVQPEVFREMLLSLSSESRLQVVVDHLLQKKAKWVRGRWIAPQTQESTKLEKANPASNKSYTPTVLETKDLFRSKSYKKAVKQVLYQEFRALPHSTIKGVLAEQNFSYTLARPVLLEVSTKSWRFPLPGFWSRRPPSSTAGGHPYIIWRSDGNARNLPTPTIKRTGSPELDLELYELFVGPVVLKQRQDQIQADRTTAYEINASEAKEADALFDCECCYASVPFEDVSVCDEGGHFLCLECIRRTTHEALYGQGWARTADLHKSTLKCFAPMPDPCRGCIPRHLVRRALTQGDEADDAWREFQIRVSSDVLRQSRLALQRCPFCNYAEIDEVPCLKTKDPLAIWNHITNGISPIVQMLMLSVLTGLATFILPILVLASIAWLAFKTIPRLSLVLNDSWSRVYKKRRGMRFRCQDPQCMKVSCIRCTAPWRDPHICFESEKTSLRTAIEASATAAIKRTCPNCMLSFVKSSGCNKMVCNCGYTMCYFCRQEVTSKEGYSHFCQHFRPNGGRCTDCERCDLYGDEDEEAVIRRAAEAAENAWRDKEGSNKEGNRRTTILMIDALVGHSRNARWYDKWLDAVVETVAK